jgi:putative two-component system response regulator
LSSKRPYQPAFPFDECMQILEDGRGSHFDPVVLDAFFRRRQDVAQTQVRFADRD